MKSNCKISALSIALVAFLAVAAVLLSPSASQAQDGLRLPPVLPELPSVPSAPRRPAELDFSPEPREPNDQTPPSAPQLPPLIPSAEPEKQPTAPSVLPAAMSGDTFFQAPRDPPVGFAGLSRLAQTERQKDNNFVPIEDRWRIGTPAWDRYGRGHPWVDDYPFIPGSWWDPYNQHVLKGDFPLLGQNTFLEVTAQSQTFFEPRQVPTATSPFSSTANAGQKDFFGHQNSLLYSQYFFLSLDLFHGDAAFRPVDWRVKLTPAFNYNQLSASELAVVSPNVAEGLQRERTFATLNEWFVETKLLDLGPNYDFVSLRVGSQPFLSDFRGFIFNDINRGVRLFGSLDSNRDQFNLVYFRQQEKDTNSFLNTFADRKQDIFIANWYIQDFFFPGYTAEFSVHYNHDHPSTLFDNNGFLVRPDPTGVFKEHSVDAVYLGWAGDGHINQFNINHAFYWALGYDSLNPIANQAQEINAQLFALELSYDQDWIRFRTSFFWSSGDRNVNDHHATGFDSILDAPNFAGGEFSYWNRQQIGLLGVNLTQRLSLIPDLRASKFQGQANFVNPGLFLGNVGFDVEIAPKLRMINNANVLWFDSTSVLQQFLYQKHIDRFIGVDLSTGFEYRPFLNNNVIFKFGVSTLLPGQGFRDIYNNPEAAVPALFAGFMEAILTF